MKDALSNTVTVLLVVCALVVTGMVVKRELFSTPTPESPTAREIDGWRELTVEGQIFGAQDAPVKIIEFSDFQCPFCAKVQPALREVRNAYPGQVAVVYRHLPLERIHPYAFGAALAAECAGAQGRFGPYHDVLYARQDSIGPDRWARFAMEAGVPDMKRFEKCLREERFRARVQRDIDAAQRLGFNGTPTFIVNGRSFSGAISREDWEVEIRRALAEISHN